MILISDQIILINDKVIFINYQTISINDKIILINVQSNHFQITFSNLVMFSYIKIDRNEK